MKEYIIKFNQSPYSVFENEDELWMKKDTTSFCNFFSASKKVHMYLLKSSVALDNDSINSFDFCFKYLRKSKKTILILKYETSSILISLKSSM